LFSRNPGGHSTFLLELFNIALSGKRVLINADIPAAHQNRLLQLFLVSGTRVKLITSGSDEISNCIALLDHAACETTDFHG
jgi:hypothetical protein